MWIRHFENKVKPQQIWTRLFQCIAHFHKPFTSGFACLIDLYVSRNYFEQECNIIEINNMYINTYLDSEHVHPAVFS
jgi:hypothetical protein